MPDGSAQNIATGLAGGLIVIALLETLLDKNVIALGRPDTSCNGQSTRSARPGPRRNGKPSTSSPECSAATFQSAGDKNPWRPRRGSQHLGGAYPAISRALPDLMSARQPRAVLTNSRKAQRKVCATGRAVLDADGRGMGIGDALDDRKSQPRVSSPSAVAPPEALKNQLPLILFDPRPLIENPHHAAPLHDDLHGRSRRRVLDGVL